MNHFPRKIIAPGPCRQINHTLFSRTALNRGRQLMTRRGMDENTVKLEFDQPVKSVTPGQAAVFYDGDVCLGGGTIEKVYKDGKEIEYL